MKTAKEWFDKLSDENCTSGAKPHEGRGPRRYCPECVREVIARAQADAKADGTTATVKARAITIVDEAFKYLDPKARNGANRAWKDIVMKIGRLT